MLPVNITCFPDKLSPCSYVVTCVTCLPTARSITPATLPSRLNSLTTLERVSHASSFPSAHTLTPIGKFRPSGASVCRPKLPRNWVFTVTRQCPENSTVYQPNPNNLKKHCSFKKLNIKWLQCVADVDIVFYPCGFFFFSMPILSRRRLDVYHTSTLDVALVQI